MTDLARLRGLAEGMAVGPTRELAAGVLALLDEVERMISNLAELTAQARKVIDDAPAAIAAMRASRDEYRGLLSMMTAGRNGARYNARVLACSYRDGLSPPQRVVDASLAYPVNSDEGGS